MRDTAAWKYYNHAAIPTFPPHIPVDTMPIESGAIWKTEGKHVLFARWTSDFDCEEQTNWWYVIKDTPFDPMALKAKRRYEIQKGKRHFEAAIIEPQTYAQELFDVTVAAYTGWPKSYRPHVDKASFLASLERWNTCTVVGLFTREEHLLCGYAVLEEKEQCVEFCVSRVDPDQEKRGANAAIVAAIMEQYEPLLKAGGYILDGARSIRHETAFQEYLEKYFQFRKAYCRLHIRYNPRIHRIVMLLYPLRKWFEKGKRIALIGQIHSLLKMEEFVREAQVHRN